MTDSMKFGPEWLRNLSHDGCSQLSVTPRYQLAEHRYGREEMLALFDRLAKAPDPLNSIPSLYVEKTQTPLALLQMTEEETRMWNRGINSDAVLRLAGKVPVGLGGPRGGRGGSVDRGRGRGRGNYHYSRGLSYEEPGDGLEGRGRGEAPSSFPRNIRPFDRSQGGGINDRGWSERNGADSSDWNGSTSPRKEFVGRGFSNDNWRRQRGPGEEEEGWRTISSRSDKWVRGGGNTWREGEKDGVGGEGERGGRSWERGRGWGDTPRRLWDEDNLPEWAMENPSESGGSFDASGAFHGGSYSDEDEEAAHKRDHRTRQFSESSADRRPHSSSMSRKLGAAPHGPTRNMEDPPDPPTQLSDSAVHNKSPPAPVSSAPTDSSAPHQPLKKPSGSNGNGIHTKVSSSSTNPESVLTKSVNSSHAVDSVVSANRVSGQNVPHSVNAAPSATKVMVESVNMNHEILRKKNVGVAGGRQKSEEDLAHLKEVTSDLVAKLMEEEEPAKSTQELWFYRDPQGEVQGPFPASDMDEWFRAGYFSLNLLVRRASDERYSQIGELAKAWGRVPFTPGPAMPPIKAESVSSGVPTTVQPTITQGVSKITPPSVPPSMPPSAIDEAILVQQYQYQMLHSQLALRQQASVQAAVSKLSQNEHWSSLSPIEQQQLVLQHVVAQPPETFVPKNPMMQLLSQLQQSKPPTMETKPPLGPLQQLIQQMGGLQQQQPPPTVGHPGMIHPAATPSPVQDPKVDPIHSLLRQISAKNAAKPQMESLWSGSMAPNFGTPNWLTQMGPIPAAPPGQLPTSLWDMSLHAKDMKTEQQIREEQQHRAEEERRREEARKQEEEKKRKEEEEEKKKCLELEEELRKKEAEKRRLEEQMRRLEDEKRREEERRHKEQERRLREEEERQRREEEERRKREEEEEERQRQEEVKRKKEEARKLEEEVRRQKEEAARKKEEEKKRKEEEKERKKKQEEERRKQEEEKRKQEEERKKREEEEDRRRRQAEAFRRLQEQQRAKAAPWSGQTPATPSSSSLADIQRQEREKKEKEQQQLILQQQQQLREQQAAQQAAAEVGRTSLQLKWADKKPAVSKVKSLTEIQAEEQEQLAKQQERERAERAQQQKEVALPPSASIWGAASQSLSWATPPAWGTTPLGNAINAVPGHWEEPAVSKAVQPPTKPSGNKSNKSNPVVATNSSSSTNSSSNNNHNSNNTNTNNSTVPKAVTKTRTKKEEAVVMKIFEQSVRADEFTLWCNKALTNLQSSVDIPTFVVFLRDIESPYEVKDYVRLYLGEGREAQEFARQFLERRSKWRSAQRAAPVEDDMCSPAPAINPQSQDFQEVKGKGKKTKKNKMMRIDNRILGFSVTAAQDRLNVGDRDYGEGI